MSTIVKKVVCGLISIVIIMAAAYGAYVLYQVVMDDVTVRIKQAVAEGIQEGVLNTVNPLNWPRTLIDHYTQ